MAHSITIRLNQAASVFPAGESTGFGLRGGVKYYDRDKRQELYTNYEVVVFASNPNQVSFYQQALVEGAIVEISARNQRIKQFQGQNGLSLSIELLDAQLGLIAQGMPKQAGQQQGGYQQQTQQQPQQQGHQQQGGFQQQQQPRQQQGGYQQQPQQRPMNRQQPARQNQVYHQQDFENA